MQSGSVESVRPAIQIPRASRPWPRSHERQRQERPRPGPAPAREPGDVHEALGEAPDLEQALVSGRLTWTKARLVARVASAADAAAWVAFAEGMTARALAREVRAVDGACLARTGAAGAPRRPGAAFRPTETDEDGAEVMRGEYVIVPCTDRVRAKWYHARALARRAAGGPVPPWQCLESVAAELISGVPLDAEAAEVLSREEDRGREEVPREAGGQAAGAAEDLAAPTGSPCVQAANGCAPASHGAQQGERPPSPADASFVVPALPPDLAHAADEIACADAFELDARLRAVLAFEQALEARMGPLLRQILAERLYRARGAESFESYVREQVGLSPRRARSLVRIERAAASCPALALAYRDARLSWVQADALVPVVQAAPEAATAAAWIAYAHAVTARRLLDAVDAALSLPGAAGPPPLDPAPDPASAPESNLESDPESEDVASQPADRQTGAKPTRSGGHATAATSAPLTLSIEEAVAGSPTGDAWWPDREDGRVMIYAPADVARLFRATLASLRRHIERRTGRLPTSGEAFEAMLDHATAAWAPERRRLREFAVHERDDWHCTVPGCSSLRNLHDHHVQFRAHGGSDDLSNRTTLCAWHHLRAVHWGLLRCTGLAPYGLRFELGIRTGHAPLAVYRSGDVRVAG